MKYIQILLIVVSCLFSFSGMAQSDKVTLLKEKLEQASIDEKPHILNLLAKTTLRKNRKESLSYAEEAIKLAIFNEDKSEEMAGYLNKAKALSGLRKHNEAITVLNKLIKVDREFENEPSLAYDLTLIGKEYEAIKDYKKARKAFEESYQLFSKLNDQNALGYLAAEYGNLEEKAGNNKAAIKWFDKSVKHYQKSKNKSGEVQALAAKGSVSANRGDYERAIEELTIAKNKAKKYGLNSLQRSIDKNLQVVIKNKEFKESNKTELEEELERQKEQEIQNLQEITVKSMEQIEQLSEAMQIAALKERLLKEEADRKAKDDSLRIEQAKKQKELAETLAQAAEAEKEKQEAQNKLLEAENNRQAVILYGVVAGLIIFGVLIVFILKSNRERKKANEALVAKNELIEKQKEVLEEQKTELVQKSHNIKESLDYAKKIQTSILPPIDGLKKMFSDSFVFFRPKDIVSGDFYWFYEYGNKIYVSVSDCTGHGVPGAFMSIIGNNLIEKAIVEEHIEKPADVLKFMSDKINEKLGMASGNTNVKDGMDMTLICIDKDTNKLSFAGARNPLYLYRDGVLTEIKATKMSVGYNSKEGEVKFEHVELDLQKGDRLYMFSDGFADQKGGPKGKKFYYKPFRQILEKTGTEPMEKQREVLEKTIVEWMNGGEQLDDMLVLGIQV